MEFKYSILVQQDIRKETASAFAALTPSAITLFRAGTWPAAICFSMSKVLDCWGPLYLNNSHLALSTLGIGLAHGRREPALHYPCFLVRAGRAPFRRPSIQRECQCFVDT
jgi:hypothetical protein